MKKTFQRIFLVLLAAVTAYTAAAAMLTHGLGVYRMHTTFGGILAVSKQYTGLAAILLWAVALIWLVRWVRARRKPAAPAETDAAQPASTGTEKKPKQRKEKGRKIPARGATKPMPQADGDSAPIPAGGATMPMPQADGDSTPIPARGATIPMPQADDDSAPIPAKGATMPMPQADGDYTPIPAAPAASIPVCPQCGNAVRAGAKFCTKCGCRLEAKI